jgi:hypothetical protein
VAVSGQAADHVKTKNGLYDLRRDPGERYNVISQYPREAAKLMEIADKMREELGDNLTRKQGKERKGKERKGANPAIQKIINKKNAFIHLARDAYR